MSIAESTKSTWMDVTNESVHTSDDVDIGDIEAINWDFIDVKKGIINVHYYYISITRVEGWDGHVVWLKLPHEEVEKKITTSTDLRIQADIMSRVPLRLCLAFYC